MPEHPYDPLEYQNLALSVVRALMEQPVTPLPPPQRIIGPGVYAIYYHGDFAPYAWLTDRPDEAPIYVGKAIPRGARKGAATTGGDQDTSLHTRLRQHAASLEQADNLRQEDFGCRYLVVVPVWISLAERFLISHFRPVWNTVLDGFGNHAVGAGRLSGARPRWDILHPGREWAGLLAPRETAEEVLTALRAYRVEEP